MGVAVAFREHLTSEKPVVRREGVRRSSGEEAGEVTGARSWKAWRPW